MTEEIKKELKEEELEKVSGGFTDGDWYSPNYEEDMLEKLKAAAGK